MWRTKKVTKSNICRKDYVDENKGIGQNNLFDKKYVLDT